MAEYEFFRVEIAGPIAWVYLNRPDKRNALNPPAWREIIPVFDAIDQNASVRATVLLGEGACFCSGIDLATMIPEIPEIQEATQKGEVKWRLMQRIIDLQIAINRIEESRKPVIAAIHGFCVGAGLDLAAACDIRICSADAVFSLREAAVGFVADVGVLQRLPLIVGQGITRELAFTARNIDAERAKEILLVSRVFADREALITGAEILAGRIAQNSPLAVQATKDVLNFSAGKSIADGLRYTASISSNIIPSEDLEEALTAFAEGRKPNFSNE